MDSKDYYWIANCDGFLTGSALLEVSPQTTIRSVLAFSVNRTNSKKEKNSRDIQITQTVEKSVTWITPKGTCWVTTRISIADRLTVMSFCYRVVNEISLKAYKYIPILRIAITSIRMSVKIARANTWFLNKLKRCRVHFWMKICKGNKSKIISSNSKDQNWHKSNTR